MLDQATSDQSLLGRVFDQYQNMMQIARCIREAATQSAVPRPRILELSRRGTGLADYLPEAQIVRHATHQDNQPILPTPVALPFPDRSFDACLVTDAYEHLPSEQRPGLLGEMIRTTHGLVLVGCPMRNEIVTRFDRIVFDFIWGKYGERFKPLKQHIEFGLEPLDHVLASLRAQGADRVVALPCNYVYRWIHQILIFFDQQHNQPYRKLYEPLNRIYNERLSAYDYREPCYRYLLVVATDPKVDLDLLTHALKRPCETPTTVAEAEGVLIQAFRAAENRAGDELRLCAQEIERINHALGWATREIERLKSVIRQLSKRRSRWRRLTKRLHGLWRS